MSTNARLNEIARATHTLEGIVKGIAADRKINHKEISSLNSWLAMHKHLHHVMPLSDLYELVTRSIEDEYIDESEQDEILQFCDTIDQLGGPVDILTKEMRMLHGWIAGIACDGIVSKEELLALEKWMLYHDSNQNRWPYDQIYNKIESILEDNKITEEEHSEFLKFCEQFIEKSVTNQGQDGTIYDMPWMLSDAPMLETIDYIVERGVPIQIKDKVFCITGQMRNGKRKNIAEMIESAGGIVSENYVKRVNYLVIGALTNKAWIYSTYGRKIETAMHDKKKGMLISIIHEDDLMKAI